MNQKLFIVLIVLVVAACSTSRSVLFQPTEADAMKISTADKKITVEDLQNGYRLYSANCSGCHSLHVPSSKPKSKWDKVLPEMFSRAHMDKQQEELVRQYIYSKL